MKKNLLIYMLFFIPFGIIAQQGYIKISDPYFEKALASYDDISGDYKIPFDAVLKIKNLELNDYRITSLSGIEKFTNLETLQCRFTQVSNIDISKNKALKNLLITKNLSLNQIDLSHNTSLEMVEVSHTYLSELILPVENSALEYLDVSFNPNLEDLDLSNAMYLKVLALDNTGLNSLEYSYNTYLEYLSVSGNTITSLDVSLNPRLTVLDITNTPKLKQLNLRNGNNDNLRLITKPNQLKYSTLECVIVDSESLHNKAFLNTIVTDEIMSATIFDCSKELQTKNAITEVETISIFPNPTTNFITITNQINKSYLLFSVSGKIMKTGIIKNDFFEIDLSNLSKGIYFFNVGMSNTKILKKTY